MASIEEQIAEIEAEIAKTKYNKATQHHIGKLKSKIAHLREEAEKRASSGGGGHGYAVPKSGHATVAMVGLPSVGKSTLLNVLTNAESEVGGYEFTTLTVIPGLMEHKDAQVQVLDLPGIIQGAATGKGRGREILAVVRNADLVMLVVDVYNPRAIDVLVRELRKVGLRLNEQPPEIFIKKKDRGGIKVSNTVPLTKLDEDAIRGILGEWRVVNADILFREDADADRLIDAVAGNRKYVNALVALTKTDLHPELVPDAKKQLEGWNVVPTSSHEKQGIDRLKDAVLEELGLIRVWLKPQGASKPDEPPLVIKSDSTIETVCRTLHRDFVRSFKYAVVTGPSAKFKEQRVGLDHEIEDGDVITVITKKGLEK